MAYKALRHAALVALLAVSSHASDSSDSMDTTASPTPSPHISEYMTASPTSMMMPNTTGNSTDTPSPNEPIPKPECDANQTVSVRYSATTGRLYLEAAVVGQRGGCVTIEQIWTARGGGTKTGAKAPLYAVDPVSGAVSENITGTWLLEEDLYVEDGITLKVRGWLVWRVRPAAGLVSWEALCVVYTKRSGFVPCTTVSRRAAFTGVYFLLLCSFAQKALIATCAPRGEDISMYAVCCCCVAAAAVVKMLRACVLCCAIAG